MFAVRECWLPWLKRFMSPKEFEVAWDGGVRGRGAAARGVPQGSPLSLVLFLVFMGPILEWRLDLPPSGMGPGSCMVMGRK